MSETRMATNKHDMLQRACCVYSTQFILWKKSWTRKDAADENDGIEGENAKNTVEERRQTEDLSPNVELVSG